MNIFQSLDYRILLLHHLNWYLVNHLLLSRRIGEYLGLDLCPYYPRNMEGYNCWLHCYSLFHPTLHAACSALVELTCSTTSSAYYLDPRTILRHTDRHTASSNLPLNTLIHGIASHNYPYTASEYRIPHLTDFPDLLWIPRNACFSYQSIYPFAGTSK